VAVARFADVTVVADSVLGEAVEGVVLCVAVAVDPGAHVLEHLALDLGVAVVEVGVESGTGVRLYGE